MNNPNRTVNDSQSGTNNPATSRSDYDQSRYYRSAPSFPSGPEYVSSSRKHEKQISSGRDRRRPPDPTDNQPHLSHTRHRDLAYSDPIHSRSTQAPLKKYDTAIHRPPIPPEETVQPRAAKYELWVPPSQHSPSSQQDRYSKERDKHEKEKEKERQRVKDEQHRERREPSDTKERHKRRQEEGENDLDRDRERRERERRRERDNEKVRDQDRQRPREEYAEKRREKSERDDIAKTEREQRKYMEMVQQRAEEKEAAREREREKRRQEKERERERERQKERRDEEKAVERAYKTDVEREKERERRRERRERENRREAESGRESERDPDRRRRRGDAEHGKERSKKLAEAPAAVYDDTRREAELEEIRRTQHVARRHKPVLVDGGPVSRDQEVERIRHATKDLSSTRRKDNEKVQILGDESEADRVRHSDKENVVRREHKTHERVKRSGASRAYGTDSEREQPHRDVAPSNTYVRAHETVLPGTVAPEAAVAPLSRSSAHQPRDDKGPLIAQQARVSFAHPGTGISLANPMPLVSETLKQMPPNDIYAAHSYPIPVSRPIDTSSTTAKYSPVSVVSANGESPRLDSTSSEVVRTKQASSSHRTLKRQSRITGLIPEQITILPTRHSQPQDILQPPVDVPAPPPGHAPRPRDSSRLHPTEAHEHSSPRTNQTLPPRTDPGNASSMVLLPSSGRAPTRDSAIIPQLHVVHDKQTPEALQVLQKDLQVGVSTPESFPSVGMLGISPNISSSGSSVTRVNQDLRTAIKGPDIVASVPTQPLLATSVEKVASTSSTKASARGTNPLPAVNDVPLRRPYSVSGESNPQERGERTKEKLVPVSSTGLSSSPSVPQVYPVDRPASIDVQPSYANNEVQPVIPYRKQATGMFESRQEGLQSRVSPLAPIPENATITTSHRPVSRLQIDPPSQSAVTDKRTPPEPTSATRVAFRSMSEPIGAISHPQTDHLSQPPVAAVDKRAPPQPTSSARVTFRSVSESSGAHYIPVVKMKGIKSGRDEIKKVVADPHHTSYAVNPDAALRSLTGQHKHDDLVVYPLGPGREEAHTKYSPTVSSRHEVSAQPSTSKGPDVNDTSITLRPGHVRTHSSNHGRTEPSPGKTAEGPLPTVSNSPSSRPTEEKPSQVVQAFLELHANELDTGASRDLDTTRDRSDRPQSTEREPIAAINAGVALNRTTPDVVPQMLVHDGKSVAVLSSTSGNGYESKNSDYRQSIPRQQHPVPDAAPREQDVTRKPRREGTKKSHSPNKDQVQLVYKEEHDNHRPPLDYRNAPHHEGPVLSGKKTGNSPVGIVPQNSPLQPEPPSIFTEVDNHLGTPRDAVQSSPGQHPASSIVKTPNQGVNRSESNQENSPKVLVSRPHESPSRYPHPVYRSSSSYPAASNTTQQSTMEYTKYQSSSHIPANHPQSHSPLFRQVPPRDVREITPVAIHNEQPLPDPTENGSKPSSKYHRSQPKELVSTSPRSARPDSSRVAPSKPFNPPINPQLPEPINPQITSSYGVQPDLNRRVAETNPVPPSSLLFSKSIDQSSPYTPSEHKDPRSVLNNPPAKVVEYSHGPSPNDQDFEKHEPRLITPRLQRLPESSELHQKSTLHDGAKVNAPEPYQETHKKSASLETIKMKPSSDQTHPPEIWHPPVHSREYEPDHAYRRRIISGTGPSVPTIMRAEPSTSIGMMLPLDEEAEQDGRPQIVAPDTDMRVYRYLRENRNRTISIMSTEAQDGTATSTLGSPTASILSQPPIRVPSHRDPMKAAHEWLSENREVAAKRGKNSGKRRVLRPGVVFDVEEDPPPVERRHRIKSRSKTQPTHT